jgi:hypothetical protein
MTGRPFRVLSGGPSMDVACGLFCGVIAPDGFGVAIVAGGLTGANAAPSARWVAPIHRDAIELQPWQQIVGADHEARRAFSLFLRRRLQALVELYSLYNQIQISD